MKINKLKTKVMKFSRNTKFDFPLEVSFSDNKNLEVIKSVKLLGLVISESLSWEENTDYICKKARKKIWILRGMKISGLSQSQLVDAYQKEARLILELAVPVWSSGITIEQSTQIKRVQKSALAAILGSEYQSYGKALKNLGIQRLTVRRESVCHKLIIKI